MRHLPLVAPSFRHLIRCGLPLAVALTLTAGCGDDGGGEVSASELSGVLASAVCDKIASCCTSSPLAQSPSLCATQIEQIFEVETYDASVAAGRMEYDASIVSTCLGRLRAASCSEIEGGLGALLDCEDPFRPLVPAGGACSIDEECVQGVCNFANETDAEGTCLLPVLDGPCALRCTEFQGTRECFSTCGDDVDLVCSFGNEASTCIAQPASTGAGIGESCASDFCDEGFCNESQQCEAYRAGGQTCTEDSQCDSFSCTNGSCEEESFCASVGG